MPVPGSGLTLIATMARSRRCVSSAVNFVSWVSAGSTVMTRARRAPGSGDTALPVGEAGEVLVAGHFPRHAGLG